MISILNTIATRKKQELDIAKKIRPLQTLIDSPKPPKRDFIEALKTHKPAIIAEIKKASPSKGIIREDFNVEAIAKAYETHGAACLSVLTDVDFFQGHPDYLMTAKCATKLPVLRKDFIIDDYQIYESDALGADCILLIVALLDDTQLQDFCALALERGLAVLVESHTEAELLRALKLPTPLMGINNRSLHTFDVSLNTTIQLQKLIPKDRLVICESGIHTHQDIIDMQAHNVNTFLVGESLMKYPDIGQQLKKLLNVC